MSDTMRGAALMTLSMALFSIEDAFIKWVSAEVTVGFIILFISILGTIAFGTLAIRQGHALWSPEMMNRPILLRLIGEAFGVFCFVSALALTPLATATAIFQASPLVVTLGAALFLGMGVGWRRWSAILIGFLGVLLIIRPGADGFDPYALLSLGAVLGLSTRDLATRAVSTTIPAIVLATHGVAVTIPVGAGLLLISGGSPLPDMTSGIGLALAGAAGLAAYYGITQAVRLGDVAVVSSFRYTRLIFGLIFAFVVFNERPDALTLLGAAIVLLSGLYMLAREAQVGRHMAKPPSP